MSKNYRIKNLEEKLQGETCRFQLAELRHDVAEQKMRLQRITKIQERLERLARTL